tara:strand:- start:58 stop:939 length:882 start_codon:yes stop_codon:yes gene_type:complete
MILKIVISNHNKAKLLMIISALSFSIMAAIVKATYHSVVVKAFSRQVFSCIIVLIIIFINNNRIIPLKKNRIKLILRCLFGTLGIYLYFYSIDNLLLANASMLTRLSPFFVTLFAFLILKESVYGMNWLIFIPMIIGCGCIIKPNSELFNPASIFAVISACSGAFAYTMIKSIGKDESPYTIIFWFTLISSGIYFIIAFNELLFLDEIDYLSLMMIGAFGVVGQIGLTISYQLSKASYVAPYSYFYIIFSGLIGFYIWNEIPDMLSLIGYFFIITSYYYLIRFQNQSLSDAEQ